MRLQWSLSRHCKKRNYTCYRSAQLIIGHSFCIRLGCVVYGVKLTMCTGCDKSCQIVEYMVYNGTISSLFF